MHIDGLYFSADGVFDPTLSHPYCDRSYIIDRITITDLEFSPSFSAYAGSFKLYPVGRTRPVWALKTVFDDFINVDVRSPFRSWKVFPDSDMGIKGVRKFWPTSDGYCHDLAYPSKYL